LQEHATLATILSEVRHTPLRRRGVTWPSPRRHRAAAPLVRTRALTRAPGDATCHPSVPSQAPVEDVAGRLPRAVTLPPTAEAVERAAARAAAAAAGQLGGGGGGGDDAVSVSGSARAGAHRAGGGGAPAPGPGSAADEAEGAAADVRFLARALRLDNNQLTSVAELADVLAVRARGRRGARVACVPTRAMAVAVCARVCLCVEVSMSCGRGTLTV
jgi:hypothetical protein